MGWIKIEDKLPEDEKQVMVVIYDEIDIGYFEVIDKGCFHWIGAKYSYVDKAYKCIDFWMELPKFPKDN